MRCFCCLAASGILAFIKSQNQIITMAFGKQPPRSLHTIIRELVDRTNTDTSRIRVLEQEIGILKSRMNSLEQDMLSHKKHIQSLLSNFESGLARQEKALRELHSTVLEIVKEMKKLASVAKIKELEHLIEIYNPIKSEFVTREEAERMIDKKTRGKDSG